jgi:protein phosphatase
MKYSFGNAQHLGARSSQQDAFGFSNPFEADFVEHAGLLAVLADGMGGLAHGDQASRTALAAFLAAYRVKTPQETVGEALARALDAANAAVCDLAARHHAPGDLGTTLIGAVLRPEGLEWVSVGDSGLFLFHGGTFTSLNTPHIYAHDLDARAAAGSITPEAAQADPQRDALTSFLGLPRLPHIDRSLRPLPLDPADCVVLASDGLFKTLSGEEMKAAMRTAGVQERCDALVKAVIARQAEHQDNVTVLALAPLQPQPVAATPVTPTVLLSPAKPRRSFKAPVAGALMLAAGLAAGVWFYTTCCQAPPLPPMPHPPAAPPVEKKKMK